MFLKCFEICVSSTNIILLKMKNKNIGVNFVSEIVIVIKIIPSRHVLVIAIGK